MRIFRAAMPGALLFAAALALFGTGVTANERAALPASTSYSDGAGVCTECHDDEHATAVMSGPHGMSGDARTPAANRGCESCHGPGGEHAKQEKQFRVAQTFAGDDAL